MKKKGAKQALLEFMPIPILNRSILRLDICWSSSEFHGIVGEI